MIARVRLGLLLVALLFASGRLWGQGETTSAIVGAVSDSSGAALAGATVTIISKDTAQKRTIKTDDAGRFSFPQLKPGSYRVRAEADGFEPQVSESVNAGLGQKQAINFTLKVAAQRGEVTVSGDAALINPDNPNTTAMLSAKALENLPNPGGDLTYPLQFASGALMNTAGSGNDFIGGTNGYGNVQFNGLPALSNGYIVDGLETNDPLTNLNSGLSTNLVLGLNSIAEVTVNTLSYTVDQGRYGAAQVNYITKSGTNQFHGNLYELWNGSRLNAADFFTNSTPDNHKPRSTVNHFGGSLEGPIRRNKLFFFLPCRLFPPRPCPQPLFRNTFSKHFRWEGGTASQARPIRPRRSSSPFIRRCSACIRTSAERRSLCWAARSTAMEARRPLLLPTEMGVRTGRAIAFERRSRAGADRTDRLRHQRQRYGLVPVSG